MDDFTPVTEAEFKQLLNNAVASLPAPQKSTYERYKVTPYRQECWRSELYGSEYVFICARCGDAIIFYDDDEDEFASGIPDPDGVLRSWGLFGELWSALYAFPDSAGHAQTLPKA
jgi:hypothetical protein